MDELYLSKLRARMEQHSHPEPNTGCWLWSSCVNHADYGVILVDKRRRLAHRVSYELHKGPIPAGLELDHLCRTPSCINPDHLEAVTGLENWRRSRAITVINANKTHCVNGHEFTPENTKPRSNKPGRLCRICFNEWNRGHKARTRGADRAARRAAMRHEQGAAA